MSKTLSRIKRRGYGCAGKPNKGLTLSEVEVADGGAVKESLVKVAQHNRALQRKRKGKNAGRHWHVNMTLCSCICLLSNLNFGSACR